MDKKQLDNISKGLYEKIHLDLASGDSSSALTILQFDDDLTKNIIIGAIEELNKTKKPCEFTDFEPGIVIFDYKKGEAFKIIKVLTKKECEYLYHDKNKQVFFDNKYGHARIFEKNRYYPLAKISICFK